MKKKGGETGRRIRQDENKATKTGERPLEQIVRIPRTERLVIKDIGPLKGENVFDLKSGVNILVGSSEVCTLVLRCLRSCYTRYSPPCKEEKGYVSVSPSNGHITKKRGQGPSDRARQDRRPVRDRSGSLHLPGGPWDDVWDEFFRIIDPKEILSTEILNLSSIIVPGHETRDSECFLIEEPFAIFEELRSDPGYEFNNSYDYEEIIIDYLKDSDFQSLLTTSEIPLEITGLNEIHLERVEV